MSVSHRAPLARQKSDNTPLHDSDNRRSEGDVQDGLRGLTLRVESFSSGDRFTDGNQRAANWESGDHENSQFTCSHNTNNTEHIVPSAPAATVNRSEPPEETPEVMTSSPAVQVMLCSRRCDGCQPENRTHDGASGASEAHWDLRRPIGPQTRVKNPSVTRGRLPVSRRP
ncbi:hypothetical protein EYF80_052209 [Liparis tanakae]|uniref:Uncharacterized protein n=1 Tax=Liparis tanakae TaxID=230148 RepID=A0A4Z2F9V3_9TELE|nr:hypothetical protein EYF80_052209 [Liparis tanakae]